VVAKQAFLQITVVFWFRRERNLAYLLRIVGIAAGMYESRLEYKNRGWKVRIAAGILRIAAGKYESRLESTNRGWKVRIAAGSRSYDRVAE